MVFSGSARLSDFARSLDHILPAMKWLFVLLLALIIFGGAAWFGYNTFVKEEIAVKKEQRGEVTPAPVPDISLPEFQAAAQLRQEGKLTEARDALIAVIQKYPTGKASRRSEGSTRGNKCCHSSIALSVSGKNGIRCEIGRCAGQDCAEA